MDPLQALDNEMRQLEAAVLADEKKARGDGDTITETTRAADTHAAAMQAVGTAQEKGARAAVEQAARATAAEQAARRLECERDEIARTEQLR
eukprot:9764980-Lingulodinium_polyedra.AAC.1